MEYGKVKKKDEKVKTNEQKRTVKLRWKGSEFQGKVSRNSSVSVFSSNSFAQH